MKNNTLTIGLLLVGFTYVGNTLTEMKTVTNTTYQTVGVRTCYVKKEKIRRSTKYIPASNDVIVMGPNESIEIEMPKYKYGYDRVIVGEKNPNYIYHKFQEGLSMPIQVFMIAPFGSLSSKYYNFTSHGFKKAE